MVDLKTVLDDIKLPRGELPEAYSYSQESYLKARVRELVATMPRDGNAASIYELQRLTELVDVYQRNEDRSGFHKWFQKDTPYSIERLPKHLALFNSTADYREVLMLGGNRCGKSRSGATVAAILATGQYPDWWDGIRFNHPVHIWAAGKTGQTTRDTVQDALMGPPGAWGTGAIPADCIGATKARAGIPNGLDTIEVKHVSGGISTIGFKSYDQDPQSFYGTAKHLVWLDEPCPELVYNESLIRTMTTNGRILHTITPKEGLTRLLADFLSNCDLLEGTPRIKGLDAMIKLQEIDDEKRGVLDEFAKYEVKEVSRPSRAAIMIGMDDVPWLDPKVVQDIISGTPPYLRDAVKNGVPVVGSGAIYPLPLDEIVLTQVAAEKLRQGQGYPAHWKYLYGMDVGWNRTAVIVVALDPDTGVFYVIDEYYQGKMEPEIHAARINAKWDWVRGAIDPAAHNRSQNDGKKLIDIYKRLGLKVHEADNAIEAGIAKVWGLLSQGRLKFMPNTPNLQNEFLLYRRDENGRIVKDHDHALDALRYAINTFQLATPMPIKQFMPKTTTSRKYNV